MNNPFSLLKYDNEYLELLETIESQDGIITPEQELELCRMTALAVRSTDVYIATQSNLDHAESQVDEWLAKWTKKKQQIERERNRWKLAMLQHCEALDTIQVLGEQGKVKIMESESVVVDGEVSEEYIRVIPEKREPDKKAIKEALKAGKAVVNARIETKKYPRIF